MSRLPDRTLRLAFIVLLFLNAVSAQTFDSETDIKNPAKIPAGVLKLLRQTKQVRECVENGGTDEKFDASWFQAARVDLNGDRFTDYVVRNSKDCLNGPRAATFWIFKTNARNFTQVFEDSVLTLGIKKTRTKGFRDIETETTMVNIIRNRWKFNGRKYKLTSTKIIDVSK
jgi:hypothetical protein